VYLVESKRKRDPADRRQKDSNPKDGLHAAHHRTFDSAANALGYSCDGKTGAMIGRDVGRTDHDGLVPFGS